MTAVVTLLVLMFSTDGDRAVRKEALFGALFFETREKSGGATGVIMGVADPTALIIMFFVFTVVLVMVRFAHQGLKRRREQLAEETARSR